jgi:hypothetical protein
VMAQSSTAQLNAKSNFRWWISLTWGNQI